VRPGRSEAYGTAHAVTAGVALGTEVAMPTTMSASWKRPRAGPIGLILLILLLLLVLMLGFARVAESFEVQALFQFGPAHVAVVFSDSVDAATALQPGRYGLAPSGGAPAAIRTVALQENQRTVVLTTREPLATSATYAVTVSGVSSRHGDPLQPGGPGTFTTVAETVTGIADVHAGINDLLGQSITIIGQVFITSSSSGGTPSGYIQDGTGRGLNLFGAPLQPATDVIGNVVEATGTVALFFTTVELTPFTSTLIAAGAPHLGPRVLPVAQASSPQWEGTYIQSTATLTGPAVPSGSNNYGYPAEDGGQAFTFRVRNSTGINPSLFGGGDVVTGAGAGSNFQGSYQITVGNAADFYRGIGPGDITPPVLISAAGRGGETGVVLEFSEPMSTGAALPTHYAVHPTGAPGSPIAVTAAAVLGSSVTLTLETALQGATSYTVEATGVQDVAGNEAPPGSAVEFVAGAPIVYGTSGAWQFGSRYVAVAFTKPVNATQALDFSHYLFAPALAFTGVTLQENGQTVVFQTTAALPADVAYTVTVSGVTSAGGEPLPGGAPLAFRTATETVVDIAAIQAEPAFWSGQNVTVIGQVTIPVSSRGGTPSGYLQDGSGRGINLFGGSVQAPVNELGSVAKVTGLVELFFTTTEITFYTSTPLATDQPHLGARRVTVAEANDARWEGTYIETGGDLLTIEPSGTSAYSYTMGDGGGASIVARVAIGLGIPTTDFSIGDRVTARGAGSSFQSLFEIAVGNRADFFKPGAGGPDTTAPYPTSASGTVGSATVTLQFSESLRPNEATNVASYRVHRAGQPLDSIVVTAAALAAGARSVYLTLATPLAANVAYTAQAAGLADPLGNVMRAPVTIAISVTEPAPPGAELRVPPVTLLRNLTRQGEVLRFEIAGPQDTKATCRVFDMQGRLVRVLFDGKLTGSPRRNLSWDARDESFELVPAGLYVCHLETTDTAGNVSRARAPIVVALRLD